MRPIRVAFHRLSLLVLALLPVVSGCVTLPEASPGMQRRALSFVPPAGKANVYVIRPGMMMGGAVPWTVDLDSTDFGMLTVKSYLHGYVSPGVHTVRAPSTGNIGGRRAMFTAEAGHNYYFLIVPHFTDLIESRPLSEAEGRQYVRECKLSGDSRFALDEPVRPPGSIR